MSFTEKDFSGFDSGPGVRAPWEAPGAAAPDTGWPGTPDQGTAWSGTSAPGGQQSDSQFGWPDGPGGLPGSVPPGTAPTSWPADDPFQSGGSVTTLPAGKPPVLWFAIAAASTTIAFIGGLVALLFHRSLLLGAGSWLLAGPVAILALGQFIKLDERQRARASYEGAWARPASMSVAGASLLAVAASAYVIAEWVASR